MQVETKENKRCGNR